MLIFQYADYLSGNSSYWQQVQIQFQSIDPFSLINKPLEKNKDYFGMSDGSKRLYETLCGFSDFNRYILGSNYDSVSSVFCKKDGEDYIPVPLQDIRDIMANIIMDEYGWDSVKLMRRMSVGSEYELRVLDQKKKRNKIAKKKAKSMMDTMMGTDIPQEINTIDELERLMFKD